MSGEPPVGDAAHALFLRGREAEEGGDFEGAVELFDEAMAISEADRHPAEAAAILHHVGNCSSLSGDKRSA